MEYAKKRLIEILNEFDWAYRKHVKNGLVNKKDKVAIQNRGKAKSLKKAIKILTEAETSRANLNIADVSESYLKKQIRIQIEDCEQKLNELVEHNIGDSDTAKMMWHLQQDINTFNLFLNSR